MKVNILVTATGGAVGQGIIKSMKASNLDCKIIAVDNQPYAAGLYRGEKSYLVPLAREENFIPEIIRICHQEDIHLILIGTDYELLTFSENKQRIEKETKAKVVVSSPEIIKISDDKWLTYNFLMKNNLPSIPSALLEEVEEVEELVKKEGFPLIIKPRIGDSSKDTYIINNEKELEEKKLFFQKNSSSNKYISEGAGFLVQKYIGTAEQEYTSTTLTFEGKCYGVLSMNREMHYGGHTTKAIIKDFPEVNQEIKKIAEILNPFGPCNFQSRLVDGKVFIFEINCRYSGTTASCAQLGFNTVAAAIEYLVLQKKNPTLTYKKGVILRYFNEVFVPLEEIEEIKERKNLLFSRSEVNNNF